TPLIGQNIRRLEDERLIRGEGQYVDDVSRPGLLHAVFVRSTYAHALIRGIRLDDARRMPGVVMIATADDVAHARPIPVRAIVEGALAEAAPLLVTDRARYVGEPIAVVLAQQRSQAEDAARAIDIEYDPLPVAASADAALSEAAACIHPSLPSNVCYRLHLTSGDVQSAFHKAAATVHITATHQRLAATALEPRCLLADVDNAGLLTLWISSQAPFRVRETLMQVLNLPRSQIRVLAPDVGGGFGAKATVYREDVVICALALQLGQPIKWVATRMEDLANTHHARDHADEAEAALAADGRVLALRTRTISGIGAYVHGYGLMTPLKVRELGTGPYAITAQESETLAVYTNAMPCGAYRGAGLPEATYLIERIMDAAASTLGIDPVEIRRRNLLSSAQLPHTTPGGARFDSGDYPAILEQVVLLADYRALRDEQAQRRAQGELVGIAVSVFVETTGNGWETAAVRVEGDGRIVGITGSHSHGQGHATTFAQILADQFEVPLDQVQIIQGDSSLLDTGMGTFGSRSTVLGGGALVQAADLVKDRLQQAAAEILEAQVEDVELALGQIQVRGAPEHAVSIAHVAKSIRADLGRDLQIAATFEPAGDAVSCGAYLGMVSVDAETGRVRVERLILVDDCGNIINPMVVHGQVHGALAQGAGEALLERMVYDSEGQLLTGSLLDYAIPTAALLPEPILGHWVTPSPLNPLGVKGAGEAGTIGAPPTIVNAVLDALRPLGVTDLQLPLRDEHVWQAIQEAQKHG
ncbi:MAG: xanthine dehydrogenase family protein molybdopterin-binding subunit, partial [Chloroflexota bacterium]